jgi:NDP-sugar pyrophosphorylase family protein
MNLHHLPHTISRVVGDGAELGVRVRYSWEVPILGSAGGPKRAIPLLGSSRFLIVNGDTLTDLDLAGVVRAHEQSGALVTMAVVPNTRPAKYSGLEVAPDGAVTGVVPRGSAERSFHFFGVQVVEASAFDTVPEGVPSETLRTLYPALTAARRDAVRAYHAEASSFDIGTPADYLDSSLVIAARERRSLLGARAEIAPDARVERSVLWDDVVVEAGAMLRECVVADGVRVPADTSWHGVTLRVATDPLAPGERRVDGLAVAALEP